jgi:NADPH-dependent 2,4-dienoyl-CoA reductase/sulfur reductase-like enzyme
MMVSKLVIVGASLAGLRAAQAARKTGFQGQLLLIGAEDQLPYDRPPLSKAYLQDVDEPEPPTFQTSTELEDELGLELKLNASAVGLDARAKQVWLDSRTADTVDFDALIIATGASPRPFPADSGTQRPVGLHALRTLDDAKALRDALETAPRTVIIGSGFIGSEIASSLRARGLPITVLEAANVPLMRSVGDQVGRHCARLHLDNGVDLRCGVGVRGLRLGRNDHVSGVALSDGTTVPAELVINATGVVPNTAWLSGSGVPLHPRDGGVLCDTTLNAGLPGIYAAGDLAHVPHPLMDGAPVRVEHWTNASEQGAQAARNAVALGAGEPAAAVPYFWSDWHGHRLQFVGIPHADEVRVVSEEKGEDKFLALYRRGDRVVGCLGIDRAGAVMKIERLIAKERPWNEALERVGVQAG